MKKTILTTAILSLFTVNVYAQSISPSDRQAIIQESVDEINALAHTDNAKNVTAQYGGNQVIAALNKLPSTNNNTTLTTSNANNQLRLSPALSRKINSIMHADLGAIAKGSYQQIMSTQVTGVGLATVAAEGMTHSGRKLLVKQALVGGTAVVSFEYLVNNSDQIEDYFSKYPERAQEFYNYLEKKKSEATDSSMYQYYVELEKKLSIDAGSIDEVAQVEATSLYQGILQQLEKQALAIDSTWAQTHPNQQCSIQDLQDILSQDWKTYLSNHPLVAAQTIPNPYVIGAMPIYSVAGFRELKENYKLNKGSSAQEQDHIPSYAAVREYLKDKGLDVTPYYKKLDLSGNKRINNSQGARNINLEDNMTSFSVESTLHEEGRTYSGRNRTLSAIDKLNLKEATLKDIAFTAYYILKNPNLYKITEVNYIDLGLTIYRRNKEMCLFDIPYTPSTISNINNTK